MINAIPFSSSFREKLLLAALALALLFAAVQTMRLDEANARAYVLAAELRSANAVIEVQEAANRAAAAQAARAQRAAAAAEERARKVRARTETRIEYIERAPVPASCQEAIDFLVADAASAQ